MNKDLTRLLGGLLTSLFLFFSVSYAAGRGEISQPIGQDSEAIVAGQEMYMEGILPSGQLMAAQIQGDIEVTGEQVICGACHRRSGMGSLEGQQVVPAVTGNLLFNPLRLPTSQTQSAPILRPAYTRDTLKLAIRTGLDANGQLLDPIMPRYPSLDDRSLDLLIDYLMGLSKEHSPGVDDKEIHFATVISDGADPLQKKALLDVMQKYFEQKNVETRHETQRAEHAPWHKEWMFKPYRKWVLHVWELKGQRKTWHEQMRAYYEATPVFAVVSGMVDGTWEPIHHFCEANHLPCLFPTTDLPVIDEGDFYSIYTNRGMTLEGEGIASHIKSDVNVVERVLQIYEPGNMKAETASAALTSTLMDSGIQLVRQTMTEFEATSADSTSQMGGTILVVWGDREDLKRIDHVIGNDRLPMRLYLSTTLYGEDASGIPETLKSRAYLIHPQEMPQRMAKLVARSTGWFRAKRIYQPEAIRVQANAYFALKAVGGALKLTRGYFYRDYFIEKIESMIDNAPYTSVYPRISLAPDQRFVSKGYFIAKPSATNNKQLEAVTRWITP